MAQPTERRAEGGSAAAGIDLSRLPDAPAGRTGWPWEAAPAAAPLTREGDAPLPRVSVVVPSFNQGRFIEETIRSILLQEYPSLQLIVMDGGSRDETVDVLRRYDAWISYWVSEPDRGQTHAINKGLARADGEIFTYLNSDDLLHPGAIHRIVEGFRADPDASVVYGSCLYVDESGDGLYEQKPRVEGFRDYLRIWEKFDRADYITQPEAFLRRSAIDEVGGFREELNSVMDLEMWLRLLSRGHRFVGIEGPVAHFRTYASQKSALDPGDELRRIVESYARDPECGLEPAERDVLLEDLEAAHARLQVRAGIAANLMGEYGKALRYCRRALRTDPAVVATSAFWSVVLHPLRALVPAGRAPRAG